MAHRILIVDDEPALQHLVGEILTQAGYETDAALSCAQALERVRTAAPDAVLPVSYTHLTLPTTPYV